MDYHFAISNNEKETATLIKMERVIFFLGNLSPKYEELVPHYEVNYFFFPFFRENLPLSKLSPDMRREFPRFTHS